MCAIEAIAILNNAGWRAIVCTNQAGTAGVRGLLFAGGRVDAAVARAIAAAN